MRPAWIPRCVVLLGALALPGCWREQPTAPRVHSITGHVVLTGYTVDHAGAFAGKRVVGDADGVLIELISGSGVIARTTTVHGIYRFDGIPQGVYIARAGVIGEVRDSTERLTIANASIAVGDTLRLVSAGDIYPVPNPMASSTDLYFALPDSQGVSVDILDLAGHRVRSLLFDVLPPGLSSVTWDGRDEKGQPASAALYWATVTTRQDERAQLLFR